MLTKNPVLRFKNDKGEDYPDWESKRLGEVAEVLDNLRKPLNEEERSTLKGTIPYWGANNIIDYINKYIFDETIILLAEDGGNFNDYKNKSIANISHGKCWVNNHTHVLRAIDKVTNNNFIFYSLVHKNITDYVTMGTRTKLTKSQMIIIPIPIPHIEEQNKIGKFLKAVDDKIEITNQKLNSLKTYKRALMQQLFPCS